MADYKISTIHNFKISFSRKLPLFENRSNNNYYLMFITQRKV